MGTALEKKKTHTHTHTQKDTQKNKTKQNKTKQQIGKLNMEKNILCNGNQKKGGVAILISDKIDFFSHFFKIFVVVVFLGLHPWHMEVPRLGVISEL